MENERICPECRRPLADDAPQGLCPECLIKAGLGSGVDIGSGSKSGQPRFIAPTPEDLARRFPQLEIISFIGQGGMGAVYKARQKQLDRIVALKILPPGIGDDPAFAVRFAREAKALAKLDHPGIVTIHDFGQADGLFFFVMEFVDGLNLRQLLQSGRVSPREALAIVPQICDALQYAHDEGIVHRDIKPENILLDRRGRVKVADFGLATLVEVESEPDSEMTSGSASLTEAGKVIGTPNYIAPEQIDHPGDVDHRADIYALGVVLYQMLTGELPGKPLEAPSRKVQIDVRLDQVVLRALESDPERRYQQANQVKTAVETITQGEHPKPSRGRRAVLKSVAVCSVLCLAAVLGWVLMHRVEPTSDVLSQSMLQQLMESNRITEAALSHKPQNPLLTEVKGRYWKLEHDGKVEVPFQATVRLYPELEDKLMSLSPERHSSQEIVPTEAKRQSVTNQAQMADWVKLKALRGWIADLQSSDSNVQKMAEVAIAESGTNALPEFLKILDDRDKTAEGDTRRYNTAAALKFIGSDLRSAVPSFVSLLVSGNQESAYAGARALAFTAPLAPATFVALTNGLVDPSPGVRDAATHGVSLLPGLGETQLAERALPTLLGNLKDTAQYVRADTASALYLYVQHQRTLGLDEKATMIVPAVIGLLLDHYSYARENAAMVLQEYGKAAAPILVRLLNDRDNQMRQCATNALSIIGCQVPPTREK